MATFHIHFPPRPDELHFDAHLIADEHPGAAGAKKPLTDSERRLKKYAGAHWHRIETIEQALAALGISAEAAPESW